MATWPVRAIQDGHGATTTYPAWYLGRYRRMQEPIRQSECRDTRRVIEDAPNGERHTPRVPRRADAVRWATRAASTRAAWTTLQVCRACATLCPQLIGAGPMHAGTVMRAHSHVFLAQKRDHTTGAPPCTAIQVHFSGRPYDPTRRAQSDKDGRGVQAVGRYL